MGYVRTDIFLSKPQKVALEKIAKKKGIFVAELVRLILDKELDRGQTQLARVQGRNCRADASIGHDRRGRLGVVVPAIDVSWEESGKASTSVGSRTSASSAGTGRR